MMISPQIFKTYDIRGIVGDTLTNEAVQSIGRALAAEAGAIGLDEFAVGRDGRLSGPSLQASLVTGLREGGADVIDLGMVTTPMVYFATETTSARCGVMVTGSHNPPEYNGLKMVIANQAIHGERILGLYNRILQGDFSSGSGSYRQQDIGDAYIDRIAGDIKLYAPMKIAIDCGSGVGGAFAGTLFRRIGCEVVELYCEVDGNFPFHHPDPAEPHNLVELIQRVAEDDLDVGLAFDGDADRLGVVTRSGNIIFPDRQLMLFAADVLSRHSGATVIYDVKCTRRLAPAIREAGGVPLMCKTGHSLVKAQLRETGAALAGEMSGHVFFKERWFGFDDGLYAGARMIEILSRQKAAGTSATEVLDGLPNSFSTPELQIKLGEGENVAVIDTLQRFADATFTPLGAQQIHLIDGVRVDYADGFGLARPSNTTPVIVLRFEGDSEEALERIKQDFRNALLKARPGMSLPF
jgi:phosphomannomutase/phosphoglucomutase